MKHLKVVALAVTVVGALALGLVSRSSATFNANRLLDDNIMNTVNSMNSSQIDTFLNSQQYSCISPNSGFEAKIPTGYSPSGGFTYGSFSTAGQVIAAAAQAYDINPRVLIVTLEKEQSLITGRNSSTYCYGTDHKYAAATGYGCPDSGGSYDWTGVSLYRRNGVEHTDTGTTCVNSSAKAGFSQQVIRAAWLLKFSQQRSLGNINWAIVRGSWDNSDDLNSCYSGPMTQGTWKVCPSGSATYYDGYRTIDSTAVHMDTGGTAALYNYTPHFPGNQNFVNLYTNWFGSPFIPNFTWQVIGQYAYTDQTMTTPATTMNMLPGTRIYVGLKVKNTSDYTWSNTGINPIYLGTSNPLDRASPFCDTTWISCNRPALMKEATVDPGGTATFEFWYKAPNTTGQYPEYFDLLAEGEAWFPPNGFNFASSVTPPTYTWQPVGQYAYTDQTKATGAGTTNLQPGDRVYVGFKVRNTGNVTWNQSGPGAVHAGTIGPIDRVSSFYDGSWLGTNRPAQLQEVSVAPGQIGTFEFWMDARNDPGPHVERFGLVAEGITWMPDQGLNFYMNIPPPVFSWQFMGQYAYTDQTKATGAGTTGLHAGDRVFVGFVAKNTGNVTWHNSGINTINVGMTHPLDRLSQFFDNTWLGQNRPAHLLEASVPPGQNGTFEFWMKAPVQPGTYREYFDLVAEGTAWFPDANMNFFMTVN